MRHFHHSNQAGGRKMCDNVACADWINLYTFLVVWVKYFSLSLVFLWLWVYYSINSSIGYLFLIYFFVFYQIKCKMKIFCNFLNMFLFSYCNIVTHTWTENCHAFFVLKEALLRSQECSHWYGWSKWGYRWRIWWFHRYNICTIKRYLVLF